MSSVMPRNIPSFQLIMASDVVSLVSANIRGLRQHFKRNDIFDYLKNLKADIICLQETHLVQKDLNILKRDWNIDYYLAGNSTNSRGVAIMLNNTFEYSVKNCIRDIEGRYIILEISIINLITFFIINVYAPNKDEPDGSIIYLISWNQFQTTAKSGPGTGMLLYQIMIFIIIPLLETHLPVKALTTS